MKKNKKIIFCFLIFLLNFENVDNFPNKHDELEKNEKKLFDSTDKMEIITKNNINKNQNKKRFLDPGVVGPNGDEEETVPEGFHKLNIYLDLYNFNYTYTNETLRDYKENFFGSIKNAKNLLEKFVYINSDIGIDSTFEEQNREEWEIDYWDSNLFEHYFNLSYYNYYILFRFDSTINTIAATNIWQSFGDSPPIPAVGVITLNANLLLGKPSSINYLNSFMLKQFIRVLGFQKKSFEFGTPLIEEEPEGVFFITKDKSEKLFEYTQKYFTCKSLVKIVFETDSDGNIHWPSRQFLGELMTNYDYPEEKVISQFTLAYLEDLGYLWFHKYTGGLMTFGKKKGCKFFNGACGRNLEEEADVEGEEGVTDNKIVFANEFFLPKSNPASPFPSCSSGRLSKTIYKLHDVVTEDDPNEFEYVSDDNLHVGIKETNYCPIAEYNTESNENLPTGSCSDSNTNKVDSFNEEMGENSFCILRSLTIENDYKPACYKMFCSSKSLTIRIGQRYIVCPRSGGKIQPDKTNYYILCPDYNLICSGSKLCNNIEDCIDKKSTEKASSFIYEYDILTTQNNEDFIKNPIITAEIWELSEEEDETCPYLCRECDLNYKCTKCRPNFKVFNEEDNECLPIVPNCDIYEDDDEVCKTCKESYSKVLEANNTYICLTTSSLENNEHYFKIDGENYYKSCEFVISNCEKCNSATVCISCNTGYNLVKGTDGRMTCQNIDIKYYHEVTEGNLKYYVKCNKDIPNCDQCTGSNYCTQCQDNYVIIEDDHTRCENLLTEKYYKETSSGKYRLCNNKLTNCEKCSLDESNFSCKQCSANYVVKHENDIQCVEKIRVKDNRLFYTNDSEINYYSCEKYSVGNCKECNNKDTCLTCQTNHVLTNESTLCIPQSYIDDKLGIYDRQLGIYTPCNAVLSDCNKCDNSTSCSECGNGAGLEESNICISKDFIENHTYILNEETHKYVSCSIINNCITCSSTTICTLCKDGFKINNNICVEATSSNGDDDKLGTGAIIGIVFGCIGFLAIVGLVAYFLLKKFIKPQEVKINSSIVINENKGDNLENPNQEENVERTEEATRKKRRIQNN